MAAAGAAGAAAAAGDGASHTDVSTSGKMNTHKQGLETKKDFKHNSSRLHQFCASHLGKPVCNDSMNIQRVRTPHQIDAHASLGAGLAAVKDGEHLVLVPRVKQAVARVLHAAIAGASLDRRRCVRVKGVHGRRRQRQVADSLENLHEAKFGAGCEDARSEEKRHKAQWYANTIFEMMVADTADMADGAK